MTKDASRSHDLSERLVRHAATGAPPDLRERLQEEWLADLQARHGLRSRLRFALGCGWASRIIAVERPQLALAGAGTGHLSTGAEPPGFTRRTSSLIVVVGLHAALFYAAWYNLAHTHKPPTIPNLVYDIIPAPAPAREPFHPIDDVDIAEIDLRHVDEPPVAKIAENLPVLPGDSLPPAADTFNEFGTPAGPQHTVVRVPGAPAGGFPNVNDFYPATAIRLGEQGATVVQVCVNPHGRLDAEPLLMQSSGSAVLDAATLKLAKAGSGHYRPTTEDGRAVASCFAYVVRFQIRNVR